MLHGFLLTDVHNVTVKDTGVNHTVALAAEGKIGTNVVGDIHFPVTVFFCEDGRTAGNGANQRHLSHGRHGNDVGGHMSFVFFIPTHDNRGRHLENARKRCDAASLHVGNIARFPS